MSSLWLVVLELISLAGEKGSLGEGTWKWVTEPGCSRGDLPSLKEEDRVDGQRSWSWLALELMEELAGLLSGQRQEQDVKHPGTSILPYSNKLVASHQHAHAPWAKARDLPPIMGRDLLTPIHHNESKSRKNGKVFSGSILSFPAHPHYLRG